MARWLYNLGTWSARRAWVVVLIWTVLLGGVGTAALTLSSPFTSKMSIPGTEFQTVIDDLQEALPTAAGGSGAVVFSTADGTPFTAAQEKAIGAVVATWKATDGVESATDPFITQKKLEKAKVDVADGKTDLADGMAKITKNTKKLADAKDKIADGRVTIAENVDKLADGQKKLNAGQRKLDAGRVKLNAGARTIARNAKILKKAQARLSTGKAQLDAGLAAQGMTEASVPAVLAQLEGAISQLQQQLTALIAEVGADDPQVVTLAKQLAGYQTQADQLKSVVSSIAEITAGQKKLDAGSVALKAGKATLSAARRKLAAGQVTINKNQSRIDDGKRQLADARITLDDAAEKVADGETKLATGKKELIDGEADLTRGERQLALTEGLRFTSVDGAVAVSQVQFTVPSDQVSKATRAAIPAEAATLTADGVNVDLSKEIQGNNLAFGTEAAGVGIAAIVLLVMLGSLLAAGLPLLTALVGVGAGLLGVLTVTHWVEMTSPRSLRSCLALRSGSITHCSWSTAIVTSWPRVPNWSTPSDAPPAPLAALSSWQASPWSPPSPP